MSGTSGFVGRVVVEHLRRAGHEVVAIVRTGTGVADELVTGDLAAPALPADLPILDAVVHLAACTHGRQDDEVDAAAYVRAVNVEGTRTMLTIANRTGAKRFVFLSSVKVNGERTRGRAFTELDPPQPEDAYGRSKLEAEDLIREQCAASGIDFVILRSPLVYGPGQKGNLYALCRAVRRRLPLPFGSVRNRRSLVYVGNLADLVRVTTEHPRAANRLLMVDDGTALSTGDLVRGMAAASARRAWLLPVPVSLIVGAGRLTGRGEQVRRLVGDLEVDGTTTRTLLDWSPPTAPAEALATAGAS